jgi:hypothetical protein
MTRRLMLSRAAAFTGMMLLMSWLAGAVWAQSQQVQQPQQPQRLPQAQQYPLPPQQPQQLRPAQRYPWLCTNACVPNVKNFGYSATIWRRWPGEEHPEEDNPRSLGLEVLRTPQGREEVPLPKAAPPKQPQQQPQQPLPQPLPPESGQIAPPEGLLIPSRPPEETLGEPGRAAPSKPMPEEGLPALPPIPERPAPQGKPSPSPPPDVKSPASPAPAPDASKPAGDSKPQATPPVKPVSLIGDIEPERNHSLIGARRADSIDATALGSWADRVEPAAYTATEASSRPIADSIAGPRVALGGYCPVELSCRGRWAAGDLRWTVVHNGWIFRLSGVEQRRQFLADPERFAPVNSGNDAVLSVDENRAVPGEVAYCALYGGRLYMFSSAATQARFNRSPQRYAAVK